MLTAPREENQIPWTPEEKKKFQEPGLIRIKIFGAGREILFTNNLGAIEEICMRRVWTFKRSLGVEVLRNSRPCLAREADGSWKYVARLVSLSDRSEPNLMHESVFVSFSSHCCVECSPQPRLRFELLGFSMGACTVTSLQHKHPWLCACQHEGWLHAVRQISSHLETAN